MFDPEHPVMSVLFSRVVPATVCSAEKNVVAIMNIHICVGIQVIGDLWRRA